VLKFALIFATLAKETTALEKLLEKGAEVKCFHEVSICI
jgi:hypothetical protein